MYPLPHSYFFFVIRAPEIYSLSKFPVYSTVLTTDTVPLFYALESIRKVSLWGKDEFLLVLLKSFFLMHLTKNILWFIKRVKASAPFQKLTDRFLEAYVSDTEFLDWWERGAHMEGTGSVPWAIVLSARCWHLCQRWPISGREVSFFTWQLTSKWALMEQ